MGRKKQLNRHHIRNKSRNGKDEDNIVWLDHDWHDAWHFLLFDLTPDEACCLIREVMQPNTSWTYGQIRFLANQIKESS
jgi:hypothetical protein